MSTRHAVVAGGGIGGLTAAIALHRRGWRVTICEQAPELTWAGAGIVLAPNALHALASIGLGPAVWKGALPSHLGLRRPDGRWLNRSDNEALAARYGSAALAVHRATVVSALVEALPYGTVSLGVTVEDVDDTGDHMTVHTSAGTLTADVVVAADGIHSALRRQCFPTHPGLRHSGEAAWRSVVPGAGLPPLAAAETWGRGERFGVVPLADGRVYIYATMLAAKGETPDHMAELTRRFSSWHDPIPALLERIDPATILFHDMCDLALPLPRLHHGRIALIGDAAHPMTPNLGQGGCQAIEDAVVLAHHLGEGQVRPCLTAYTRDRHTRTANLSRRSRQMGRLVQLTHPAAAGLRDLAVRLTPDTVMMRAMDTVLTWRPPR
ncbi:FAD-dependent monooxygenase [Sinosporangium siamense]|uniref:Monooxygenase n=1 Tax=Sinosporangium siamense TaxID=1367973 RepID=A0A919RP23_9ACTN|nr:FAD-dependent monooxygenase [Sinosporangium siamense]GII96014.1 monooxygenase [Sinosporangium siamense]